MPVPGPQLPPSLLTKRKREDSEDREGQQKEPSTPDPVKNVELDDSSSTKKSRAIGPTLPPANLDQLPSKQPEDGSSSGDDDDNDDDDFGPSLPRGPQESPAMNSSSTRPEPPVAVERDSWMTVPPSQSDWTARVDPTKLRNRKFNTGKGAKGPSPATERGISVKWTETPAEKKARLEREMMGIQEAGQPAENRQDKLKDEAAAKRIREYSEKSRGPTLYSEHQKRNPQDKEDDPGARAFDREKDIVRGMKISHSQRKEMMQKASDFGSRFSSGTFL